MDGWNAADPVPRGLSPAREDRSAPWDQRYFKPDPPGRGFERRAPTDKVVVMTGFGYTKNTSICKRNLQWRLGVIILNLFVTFLMSPTATPGRMSRIHKLMKHPHSLFSAPLDPGSIAIALPHSLFVLPYVSGPMAPGETHGDARPGTEDGKYTSLWGDSAP